MRGLLGVGALVCLLAGAGCYKTPKVACAFLCGEGSDCPSGYVCGGDDRCHQLIEGVPAECEPTPGIDGSVTPMIDATPEETPDGPPATPDAMSMIDAPPAVIPDAPPAPPPDARPPFDAPPPIDGG